MAHTQCHRMQQDQLWVEYNILPDSLRQLFFASHISKTHFGVNESCNTNYTQKLINKNRLTKMCHAVQSKWSKQLNTGQILYKVHLSADIKNYNAERQSASSTQNISRKITKQLEKNNSHKIFGRGLLMHKGRPEK